MKKILINNNFALIWSGKFVSMVGDRFYLLVLALWVLKKSNSPSLMGLVLIASALPSFLFSFISGTLVDLKSKKNIMIATDFIRGFLIVAISIMEIMSVLEVWHIIIVSIIVSILNAFFDPAVKALIPEVVDNENLPHANSLEQLISGISTVVGPVLGALSVGIVGFFGGFIINGLSFIISAIFEMFIKEPVITKKADAKQPLIDDIKKGYHFVIQNNSLLKVIAVIAVIHFAVGSFSLILPFFASSISANSMTLGLMQGFLGIGMILGAAILNFRKLRKNRNDLLTMLVIALGLLYSVAGIMKIIGISFLMPYLFVILLLGLTISNAATYWQLLLQRNTPPDLRGRVFGIVSIFANISMPIAYALVGFILEYLAFSVYLIIIGLILTGLAILWRKSLYGKEI